jgi:hypothetical protein
MVHTSRLDTGAASPDGKGMDWRRQWSPDGDSGGGDACPMEAVVVAATRRYDVAVRGRCYPGVGGGCGREQHGEIFRRPCNPGRNENFRGPVKPGLTSGLT